METRGVWRQLVLLAPVQYGGLALPSTVQVFRKRSTTIIRPCRAKEELGENAVQPITGPNRRWRGQFRRAVHVPRARWASSWSLTGSPMLHARIILEFNCHISKPTVWHSFLLNIGV